MRFIPTVFFLLILGTAFGQSQKPSKLCVVNNFSKEPMLDVTLYVGGIMYQQDDKGCFTLKEPPVGSKLEFTHSDGVYLTIPLEDAGTFKGLHNRVEMNDGKMADAAGRTGFEPEAPAVVEKPAQPEIYTIVEEAAEFPGGRTAMNEYFMKNLRYPQEALDKGIQGKCYVEFIIDTDGKISDAKIKKSIAPELDAEALRLVEEMPPFIPARDKGKAVKSRFILPVTFKIQE